MRIVGQTRETVEYDDVFIGVIARPPRMLGEKKAADLIATRHGDLTRLTLGKFGSIPEAISAWDELEKSNKDGKKTHTVRSSYNWLDAHEKRAESFGKKEEK